MCGVAGIALAGGEVGEEELVAMREALVHRGPDDAGAWIDASRRLGLAHRRLSIIDLTAAGKQPMASDDGKIVLVFNGEIYNFQALRQELEQRGHCFRSRSDTEVVIYAYKEWGEEFVNRLNGMFALALYDAERRCLLLARDRFGEKPLYYYRRGGTFLFASELKALHANARFTPEIDRSLAFDYVLFGYLPGGRTIFAHTHKINPGTYMRVDMETLDSTHVSYWDPLDVDWSAENGRVERGEAVQALDELLRDSVRQRLVADVPVGAFLSGGIDSSLVVSVAASIQANIHTYSIGVKDETYDEAPYAREIARHLGSQHREYYLSTQEAQQTLLELPGIFDEPFADSSAIPTHIVSRIAREDVKVVLSGDGGDELFGGYTTYAKLAIAKHLLVCPQPIREGWAALLSRYGWGSYGRHADLLKQGELWQQFLYLNERAITKLPDATRLVLSDSKALDESFLAKSFNAALSNRGVLSAALYADVKTYLEGDILAKVDRASMATSLEVRVPLLDHRISDFAARLPDHLKTGKHHRQTKVILRQVLSRYVPSALFERPKRGFSIPLNKWLRGELKWLLDRYLDHGDLRREGLFDADFVDTLKAEHLSGRRDREAVLWALIFWGMWKERWNIAD